MIHQAPTSLLEGLQIPEFYILLISAAVLSMIPIIKKPFLMVETFLHEMSHGLSTVILFGKIHRIHLRFDGSGDCYTSGGIRPITLFSGYTGASFFGLGLFYLGSILHTQHAEPILYSVMIFIIFASLMWARDIQTFICMYAIGSLFYFPLKHELFLYTSFYLKFIGMYVTLSAFRAPLDLIDGKSVGDGAELFKYTLLPEGVWILVWVLFGAFCIFEIYSISMTGLLWIPQF